MSSKRLLQASRRTPQLLERKLKLNNENSELLYVEKTLDQIEKLNSLITDLLDVSKIENGKLKINKKPENLESVLQSAIETILHTSGNNVKLNVTASNPTS
jgi:K+-sensing histidine kinase KdpD